MEGDWERGKNLGLWQYEIYQYSTRIITLHLLYYIHKRRAARDMIWIRGKRRGRPTRRREYGDDTKVVSRRDLLITIIYVRGYYSVIIDNKKSRSEYVLSTIVIYEFCWSQLISSNDCGWFPHSLNLQDFFF